MDDLGLLNNEASIITAINLLARGKEGKRNIWLRFLDSIGLGFDS